MLNLERSYQAGELICADNLEVLEGLDGESADLIYLDPPFGTGTRRRGKSSDYADAMSDPGALTAWLVPRFEHCRRVLAPTGSLFVHLDYRTVHYVKVALDRLFGRARFVNEIIWCYSVGGKSTRRFARKHDTILWYARTADYAFYPDRVRVPRKANSHMRLVLDEDGQPVQEKTDRKTGVVYRYPVNRGKVPEDWWIDIETLNRGDAERTGYPTQKPERLLERLVLGCTEPGDLVADFFCGSGTTCAVAARHGRRWLGVDASAAAIAVARERLERTARCRPTSSATT
jgi:DNA modification methylase